MTESAASTLNDRIQPVLDSLEKRFIFRKLGLCFDYASSPDDFPRKSLPSAREARDCEPNDAGLGTGIALCARNDGLLFDGYLLRLELGIAGPDEERIFDRLIGGLIRIATTAPKNYLVRGLTPDGRGFYPQSDPDSHLLWAFAAWRGFRTAAIATESQEKFSNIASKWISRLERDDWTLARVDAKGPGDQSLLAIDPFTGPVFLALLAAAADITGNGKWSALYEEKVAEQEGARLQGALGAPQENVTKYLHLQIALHMLKEIETNEERRTVIARRMADVAALVAPFLSRVDGLKEPILEETPDLDWRTLGEGGPSVKTGEGNMVFQIPVAWRRIAHETETVRPAAEAALAILLTADKGLCEPHVPAMTSLLDKVPWDRLWVAAALAPVLSVHARGTELGLWDESLLALDEERPGVKSWDVRVFLAPDFDEKHPEIAGHTESRRKKQQAEQEQKSKSSSKNQGRRRRRRRRR